MKVYEFGETNEKTFLFFPCTAEPWWVFEKSAALLSKEFHLFLMVADGHDEAGTEFLSVEKNAEEAAGYLNGRGIKQLDMLYGVSMGRPRRLLRIMPNKLDMLYGVSMGGSSALYMLAAGGIPVRKAVIDAGIAPCPYPKPVCRLIALRDFLFVFFASRSLRLMKLAMPPKRWTPEGEDPREHYRRIFEFTKNHYSAKTIYRVFWSANNYRMPETANQPETRIEYWYGEEEKKARKAGLAYTQKVFPETVPREFKGLRHAELVLMHAVRFRSEILRFWNGE